MIEVSTVTPVKVAAAVPKIEVMPVASDERGLTKSEKAVKAAQKEGVVLPALREVDKTEGMKKGDDIIEEQRLKFAAAGTNQAEIDRLRQGTNVPPRGSDLYKLLTPGTLDPARQAELELELQNLGMDTGDLTNVKLAQEAVDIWDHHQRLIQVRRNIELLKRVGLWQRGRLAIEIQQEAPVLGSDRVEDTSKKAEALAKIQSGYEMVLAREARALELNEELIGLLGDKLGTEAERQTLIEKDAQVEADKHVTEIEFKNTDLFRKEMDDLNDQQKIDRQQRIQEEATAKLTELDGLRPAGQKMTVQEKQETLRQWGVIIELDTNGVPVIENGNVVCTDVDRGSVMETLLLSQGFKQDAKKAYEANLEAVKKGDNNGVEMTVLAANIMVKGEAMEVIATAMMVGKMNEPKTLEAIKLAREMGLVDQLNALEKIYGVGQKVGHKGGELIRGSIEKICGYFEQFKDPAFRKEFFKKIGNILLYVGIGILALLALLLVGGMTIAGGAIGGGGH